MNYVEKLLKRESAKANILRMMLDHEWHSTVQLNDVAGGTEGTRRLRELRATGLFIIECEPIVGSSQYQYRIVPPVTPRPNAA